MRAFIFSLLTTSFCFAGATDIEILPGTSVTIKAGDKATVTCSGSVAPITSQASVSAYCANINYLVFDLDTENKSTQEMVPMINSSACKSALTKIKPALGSFSGVKSMLFCNNNELVKVRLSATTGEVDVQITSMANSSECQNAL